MTTPVIIRKYGGEALASPARIRAAVRQIVERAAQVPLVVVASARLGVTDHLLELVREGGGERASRSADRVVASGEIVSAGLLAAAIQQLGRKAVALDGREAGLLASGDWASARLRRVQPRRVRQILSGGAIPVVAGFQARRRRGLATLGRGGSDLTAVALAAALGGECELVKDVGALFTADPRLCPAARPLPSVNHAFLANVARAGARICNSRAAAVAARSGVPLRFVHFSSAGPSTLVSDALETRHTAIVLRREVALLFASGPAGLDGPAIRAFLNRLRRRDAGADLTAARDELGWRLVIYISQDSVDAARAPAADLGITLTGQAEQPLDAISIVGAYGDDWPARLQAAAALADVTPIRVSPSGRRIVIAVAANESNSLLQALHREFVERCVEATEVRCSA
jgi:aspartate kinase